MEACFNMGNVLNEVHRETSDTQCLPHIDCIDALSHSSLQLIHIHWARESCLTKILGGGGDNISQKLLYVFFQQFGNQGNIIVHV